MRKERAIITEDELTVLFSTYWVTPSGSQEQPEWSSRSAGHPQRKGQQLLRWLQCSKSVIQTAFPTTSSCHVHVQSTSILYVFHHKFFKFVDWISCNCCCNLWPYSMSFGTHACKLYWFVQDGRSCNTHTPAYSSSSRSLILWILSKIPPGPVWTWVLSYALSVQGSTETWGPTCHVFDLWTSMICHESSRWCWVPSAIIWWTAFGRAAHLAAVNQHLMLHGKETLSKKWHEMSVAIIDVI